LIFLSRNEDLRLNAPFGQKTSQHCQRLFRFDRLMLDKLKAGTMI
jgi:hypothetical protein